MARPKNTGNSKNLDILRYALTHLERERDEIQQRITHITRQIGGRAGSSAVEAPQADTAAPRKKRVLSAAARKRIAAAQKKRWEAHRKAKAQ
jgi:hypothetical protein